MGMLKTTCWGCYVCHYVRLGISVRYDKLIVRAFFDSHFLVCRTDGGGR